MTRIDEWHDHELSRYVLPSERVVVQLRHHWAALSGPAALALAGTIGTVWLDMVVPVRLHLVSDLAWLGWFALVFWFIWELFEWRRDWFVATDKRLLMFYGFVTRRVAMMPLVKVTDMTYNRSIPGRLFGYGRFVLESAGQDQALRTIDWVPEPDLHYAAICEVLFGDSPAAPPDLDDGLDTPHDGPYDDGPGWSPGPPDGDEELSWSVGMAVREYPSTTRRRARRSPNRQDRGDDPGRSIYRSPDLVRGAREAETGPIPIAERPHPRPRRRP